MLIAPRAAHERLSEAEPPHLLAYDAAQPGAPLLVWLSGAGGQPASGPRLFCDTVLRQG